MNRLIISFLILSISSDLIYSEGNLSVITDMSDQAKPDKFEFLKYNVSEIIFAERKYGNDGHWYANLGYYARDMNARLYNEGSRLCKLEVMTGNVTPLLDDPLGTIRDPVVHYDGKTILFSYRKGGTPHFHLYEIQADGTGLKQLTSGHYDDIEPAYLPDNGIMFISGRAQRWVNCWLTQVATLYRCDRSGNNIRLISANIEHDNTPWVLPDGRILYQRWEYVDRSQVNYHHLWTTNPDGTGQMVFFGNLHPGALFIDAKPIPNSDKIILINSPGHGKRSHMGHVAILDSPKNPDDKQAMKNITGVGYRDPWAFSENFIMAARENKIIIMDSSGNETVLFQGDNLIHEPRPLSPHDPERIIPSRVDLEKKTGEAVVMDIYHGRNMGGIKKGSIEKILIIETLPKPINYTGGMSPMSAGGTFTIERVLGTVPVEKDGSVYMELPANRPLVFAALNKENQAIKRMQSFLSVAPGEKVTCIGCHENRSQAPFKMMSPNLMATKRQPGKITPLKDLPDIFDFPRDIQPILDKYCISCHNPDDAKGGVQLAGDRGPLFSISYFTLTFLKQFTDGRNKAKSNYPPFVLWDPASPLMKKISGSHHNVKVTDHEKEMIRTWINLGAPYPGTYAAMGTGAIGGYEKNLIQRNDWKYPEVQKMSQAIQNRCAECHSTKNNRIPFTASDESQNVTWKVIINPRFHRHLLYNLSQPEKSLLLMAPLSVEADGHARREGGPYKCRVVFTNTDDPDYQVILKGIEKTKWVLDKIKRFDMAGFRPRKSYVREMIRYGILPETFDFEKDPINVYEVDRKYFKSQWYYPPGQKPKLYSNTYPPDKKWHADPPLIKSKKNRKKKKKN